MKCGKEYAKLERIFENKSWKEKFNEKQKCPKLPVNKGVFEAHPFWVCPSKKHMEFLVNTIQGVACLHSKLKQDVRLHPPVYWSEASISWTT